MIEILMLRVPRRPLCHYWMVWMEANLDFDGAWYGTGAKVLADQTVWSL